MWLDVELRAMTFCSPCKLFITLNTMLCLFSSDSSPHFCQGTVFFQLFIFLNNWLLCLRDDPTWLCISLAHNNSEGIIYKSQLKWGKKNSCHLLIVVWFIIYTCTGIRGVSLCVMSHQGCNICLAGFRDATPHLAGCRQCALPLRHCFRN